MQVSKWGNSLAVRLPKALVDKLELAEGDELDVVEADKNTLVVAKAANKQAVLKELSKFHFELPADYKFNRDEANER
jgi:antitoxin MazE